MSVAAGEDPNERLVDDGMTTVPSWTTLEWRQCDNCTWHMLMIWYKFEIGNFVVSSISYFCEASEQRFNAPSHAQQQLNTGISFDTVSPTACCRFFL